MTLAQIPFEAFFLDSGAGRCFCLHFPSLGKPRGAVLHIHPFAEELNRSRRMTSLQARALASAGYTVLLVDLAGCGDSGGDFGEATWGGWLENLESAAGWLRQRADAPLWLWGLRAGCLLGASLIEQGLRPAGFLMWQPVLSGEQALRQFLRLKTVAEVAAGRMAEDVADMRRGLEAGADMIVAGYRLNATLAKGMGGADLRLGAGSMRIECFEMAGGPAADLSPALSARLALWRAGGHAARAMVVDAPSFWQTVETSVSPALIEATIQALQEP